MTADPDPILAALGGNIPAAREFIREKKNGSEWPGTQAVCDLALRALDAMERPEIDRLLSEPAPASDGRTGCAECERLARELEAAQATNKSLERYRTTVGNLRSVMQDDDHRAWVAMGRPENTRTTNAVLICEKFAELTEAIATLTRERDAARADQAAMAKCIRRQRESLEDIERIASENQPEDPYVQHTPWTYVLVQCARAIGPMADMTDRLAALPAEKPAEPAAVFHAAAKPAEPANPPASPDLLAELLGQAINRPPMTADAEALPADPNALREIIRQRAQALHDAKHKLAVMQRDVMRQRGEAFDREIKAILQGGGS